MKCEACGEELSPVEGTGWDKWSLWLGTFLSPPVGLWLWFRVSGAVARVHAERPDLPDGTLATLAVMPAIFAVALFVGWLQIARTYLRVVKGEDWP